MEECIRVEHISHFYMPGSPFEKKSLDDVSFSVQKGEFFGVIGHTGSGKSTLIQMLNGLLSPSEGRILVNGTDLHASKETLKRARAAVGMVFQYPEYQLFEETVRADIAFGPTNLGLSKEQIEQDVLWAARTAGVAEDLLDRSPFELSGGQKRRAAIAGVLAMKPQILVLDEPVAGLDPKGRRMIMEQIAALPEKEGITVIVISHSMEDMARYADRILVMDHGHAVCCETPQELFSRGEELNRIGLTCPMASVVMRLLADRGFAVDRRACTTEAAQKEIAALLRGGDPRA